MFSLPGIVALVIFLLGRPFDLFDALKGLPLLYAFCGVALLGLLMDLKHRFAEARAVQHLHVAMAFIIWCALSVAVFAPGKLGDRVIGLAILGLIYVLIAQGIRTFKAFEVLAATLLACGLWVASLSFHQGLQPTQCVAFYPGEMKGDIGHADGRPCELPSDCTASGNPNYDYGCERVGAFGISSIVRRVRYVGTLKDPNETALFVASMVPIAYAFYRRRSSKLRLAVLLAMLATAFGTTYFSQSRGGLLMMGVTLGFMAIKRWGFRKAATVGLPVIGMAGAYMLLEGALAERSGADESTFKRLELLSIGLMLFINSPLMGVGFGQFGRYSDHTAHNSVLLAASELGVVGLFLWSIMFYLAVKTTILASNIKSPEAAVAQIWGEAISASLIGLAVGTFFLSFTYHYVLWVFFALTGAFYASVRAHDRSWRVPFGRRDFILVSTGLVTLFVAMRFYTLVKVGW